MMTTWVMVIILVSGTPSSMITHSGQTFASEQDCVDFLIPSLAEVETNYASQGIAVRGTCVPVGVPAPI
jgi:hypothetical protein